MNNNDNENTPRGCEPWPEIVPFDDFTPPPFPLECFPEPLGEFGRALSTYTQTDPAMTGVLLLGILGALFQNKFSVVSVNGNIEQASIYAVAIAPPAERKSEVIRRVIRPLHRFEDDYNVAHADDVSQSRTQRRLLEKGLTAAEKGNNADALFTAQAALDSFRERKPLTLIADDTTVEALVSLMAENGERMLIASDEGGIFTHMKGRYKQNGDDTELYLKAHSGGRVSVHRKSRDPEKLNNPALSLVVAVQPFVVENTILEEANNARGLTARLVYAVCAERAGSRKAIAASLPDDLAERYEHAVQRCLSQTVSPSPADEIPAARLIALSEEAREQAICYFDTAERRIAEGLERAKGWNGKAFGLMMRIAGQFHAFECMERGEDPVETPLPAYIIVAAAIVTDCLAAHAEMVFAGSDKKTGDAVYLLRRIGEMGGEFNKRELWVKARRRFANSASFDETLRVLEESGYIRIEVIPTDGRPLTKIQVNPAVNST